MQSKVCGDVIGELVMNRRNKIFQCGKARKSRQAGSDLSGYVCAQKEGLNILYSNSLS